MPRVIAILVNHEDMRLFDDVEPEYEARVDEGYPYCDDHVAGSVYCINEREAYHLVDAFNGGEYHSLDSALQALRMEYRYRG